MWYIQLVNNPNLNMGWHSSLQLRSFDYYTHQYHFFCQSIPHYKSIFLLKNELSHYSKRKYGQSHFSIKVYFGLTSKTSFLNMTTLNNLCILLFYSFLRTTLYNLFFLPWSFHPWLRVVGLTKKSKPNRNQMNLTEKIPNRTKTEYSVLKTEPNIFGSVSVWISSNRRFTRKTEANIIYIYII